MLTLSYYYGVLPISDTVIRKHSTCLCETFMYRILLTYCVNREMMLALRLPSRYPIILEASGNFLAYIIMSRVTIFF